VIAEKVRPFEAGNRVEFGSKAFKSSSEKAQKREKNQSTLSLTLAMGTVKIARFCVDRFATVAEQFKVDQVRRTHSLNAGLR
jgi:hypothetical protein